MNGATRATVAVEAGIDRVRAGILGAPSVTPETFALRVPGRFALALSAAHAADAAELARAFRGLSDDGAEALGRELLAALDTSARLTGDRVAWAFASNRIPWPHMRQAGREWQGRLEAEAAAAPRPVPGGGARRVLARLATRLLRRGVGGRELLNALDGANAGLPAPLAPEAVGDVAVWAAGAVNRGGHVAR